MFETSRLSCNLDFLQSLTSIPQKEIGPDFGLGFEFLPSTFDNQKFAYLEHMGMIEIGQIGEF